MSGKPTKMKAYSSFDDWKADQSDTNQELINELQNLIHTTASHLTITVKWGQGCWVDVKEPKIFIHAEDDHVQLGFYNGSSLSDPQNLLSGNGKFIRFVRIYGLQDINKEAIVDLINQAIK